MDVLLNDDLQGETIKRYLLEQNLGRGVLGDAYKSIHPDLQQYVVVKILHPFYGQAPRFRRYFERDLLRALSLTHPYIIPVIDYGITMAGYYFLVTPFSNGLSLADYQAQLAAPIAPMKAFHLLAPIASGLQFVHAQGMIHGNLKPGNVLIDDQENSFLADWAMAQIARLPENAADDVYENALAYMAPERILRSSAETAVDVYALGAVMYKMLTGQRPSRYGDPGGLIPPTQHNPRLPAVLESVILKALAADPENRFASPDAVMVAFRRALAQTEDQELQVRFPSGLEAFVSIQIQGHKIQRALGQATPPEGQPVTSPIYQRYLAYDTVEEQQVSLTVLRMTRQSHPELVVRFLDRLPLMASVSDRGLARFTQSGFTKDKRPYAAFAYVPGPTLAEMLPHWTTRTHALSVPTAFQLIRQIASALEVAHWAGLVHQEFTPDQIIVPGAENLPVITGLEIPAPPRLDVASANPHDPGYVPPDQYSGEPVSAQTNIYALGVMLYELLSGYRPNLPVWQVARFGLADIPKPTPLYVAWTSFTPDTYALLARCLISDANERFPNLSAFMVHLDKALASEEAKQHTTMPAPLPVESAAFSKPSLPGSAEPQRKSRAYWPFVILGGVLVLLLILAMLWWRSSRPVEELLPTPTALVGHEAASPPSTIGVSMNALAAEQFSVTLSPVPLTPTNTVTASPTNTQVPTNTPTAVPPTN